jgi:hypothetical protein
MVGMTVAALFIICDDNVRAVLTYNRYELAYNGLHLGLGESMGLRVGLPAMHARIMVAKRVEMRHTEDGCRSAQLGVPHLREALTVGRIVSRLETQAWVLDVTKITVGTGHEYRRVALLCR